MTQELGPDTQGDETPGDAPKAKLTKGEALARARAKKAENKEQQGVTLSVGAFESLMARIGKLEQEKTELANGPEIEISTTLPDGRHVKPGTIVNISADPSKPDFRKAHWSKTDIEETYEMVTFRPEIDIVVGPHGVKYELRRRQEITVPSIVRDYHDAEVYRIDHQYDRYRPVTLSEHAAAAEQAQSNPGQQVWTRVSIVGHGLDMGVRESAAKTE